MVVVVVVVGPGKTHVFRTQRSSELITSREGKVITTLMMRGGGDGDGGRGGLRTVWAVVEGK